MSRLVLLVAVLSAVQAPAAPARPLYGGAVIRDSLAGGGRALFSIDVPADTAARVVLRQEGIDVGLTLRRAGSAVPERGFDFRAGTDGEELAFPPIADAPATWHVVVSATLPRAKRGDYTISVELAPSDDRARAVAAARARFHRASDAASVGDAASFQEAQAGYAASAAAAEQAGDAALAAEATYQGARIHDNLGDQPGAIVLQRRALEMFRALGRRDREARVLNRLGDLSRKVGEANDAERYFQEALPIARETNDPATVADILNNSGLFLLVLGRPEEAIRQLESALPLAQEVGSASVEAAILNNTAEAYFTLGQYDKAVEVFRRAGEPVARLNLPRRTARHLFMTAEAQFENGDRAGAERGMMTAVGLYEQSGDRAGMAAAYGLLGRMYRASGDSDRALELLARAQPLLHEVQNRLVESRVLTAWAEIEIDRGEIDAALARLDASLEVARLVGNPQLIQQALFQRARALQKKDRSADAIAAIAAAVDGVESMRTRLVKPELRTSYLTTVRSYFDLYVDLLQRQGSVGAAFEVSERARARTLLDGLAESASKISRGVDPALLARQRLVQDRLNAKESYRAQVALADGDKSGRAVAAGRDVAQLLDQWTELRARIRATSPGYSALHQPEPVSVSRVQTSLLDAATALVEYHLGRDRSYVWVIDRQSITAHDLPAAAAIDPLARRYHELLSREAGQLTTAGRQKAEQEITALGRRLAAAIWKPIESRVRGKRLLVVADGALQYLPFAALPASSGEPVLARHEIVYLPSASVLETLRSESRPVSAGVTAAVFADPVFSKNDARFAGARDTAAPARTRASDGGVYGRLHFSRREAEAIAAAAPGTLQALDFSASKSAVTTRDLRKYRILHFATHGSLNTEHPELSGLVFSLVDRAGKPVDGFLRLHEIYNLDLDADLVVLSACRTALGKEVHGEGLIGLTRGFMYAGASRVVSSVWNVDDRASALLMSRFYAAMLTKRMPPAAALRDAQLSMLRDPRWANPHNWAAFGLQGEWK